MTTADPTMNKAGDAFSKFLVDIMFFGVITVIKVIGCYIYMTVIIALVSLLCLAGVVLTGLVAGMLFGKMIGILVGVLVFGVLLIGPFSKWMSMIKTATQREFFGNTVD